MLEDEGCTELRFVCLGGLRVHFVLASVGNFLRMVVAF